jgi:FixJ family two-component response regulator
MAQDRICVAIVDDDAGVRRALARLLRASRFDAVAYESATEFLASLSGRVPDCLVVDLQMPEMNGLELQQHLARASVKIPTVVITAHDGVGTRERCQSAGAAAYLLKPLDEEALISAIRVAIRRADPSCECRA